MLIIVLLSFPIVYVIYELLCWRAKTNGPRGYPIIGYVPSKTKAHTDLTELSKNYGPIFTYNSFGTKVFVISRISAVKEFFMKHGDVFMERIASKNKLINELRGGNYGVLLSHGDIWKDQRRFSLSALRDLGFGKPVLEGGITDEVEYLLAELLNGKGQPQDLQFIITKAVSNIISKLIFGTRFSYEDAKFFKLIKIVNEETGSGSLVQSIGLLKYVGLIRFMYRRLKKTSAESLQHISELIQLKQQNFCASSESNSYVESFMIEKRRDNNERIGFEDQQLLIATKDLFAAGTETTSTTLRWGLLLMSLYPEHQDRMYNEIKDNIGEGSISYGDRTKVPFVEAFILEVQRFSCLVPIIVRCAVEDVTISGHVIRCGTPVIMNIWSCLFDEQHFPQPNSFIPERFIDEQKRLTKVPDAFIPFGIGKRVCLGESLAKMELFLFFSILVQRLQFSLDPTEPRPSLDHQTGITLSPQTHKLIVKPRI